MPLDAYSSCPGGTGKKIKFCCPDLLGEFEKIERMLEGEQYEACLSHVERLEKKQPGRACLLGTKCLLFRATGRVDEAESVVAAFLQLHPQNPIALIEKAFVTAAKQGGRAAMPWLQRAMVAGGDEVPSRACDMLESVGQVLMLEGEFLAARAVLQWAAVFRRDDPLPAELLARINTSRDLPLWLKDERRLADCPADAPWRAEFDEAIHTARRGQWSLAEERFLAIAAKAGDQPAIWRNLALVRGWLADRDGCVEALRKFAAMEVPLEDAVEAEAVALFLGDDPLGDRLDVLSLTYPIEALDQFQVSAAAARRIRPMRVDLASLAAEGEPPPLAVYLVLDRELPAVAEGLTLSAVPRLLCQAFYYGRQTDRAARLELHPVAAGDVETVESVLRESFPGILGPQAEREVTERISRTQELLARNWSLPHDTSPEQFEELVKAHYDDALLTRWPATPLGIFDGKTPQEASADPACRVRLLAAIMMVEFWAEQGTGRFDFNRLRAHLGLPTLDAIDPREADVSTMPVGRLGRVDVERLPDEALGRGFFRALGLNALPAVRKYGRALVRRPSTAGRKDRLQIYSLMARIEDDPDRALSYVEEGRVLAEAAGQSSAPWDLMELSIRYARREPAEIDRLLRHLNSQHIREPGVATAIRDWLVQIGAIQPDGAPAAAAGPPQQAEPGLVAPGQPGAEPGKLWTPGGQQPAGEKPKLWTPGMD